MLLPAPLGPMKPKISPLPMAKLRLSTATKSPYALGEVDHLDHESNVLRSRAACSVGNLQFIGWALLAGGRCFRRRALSERQRPVCVAAPAAFALAFARA